MQFLHVSKDTAPHAAQEHLYVIELALLFQEAADLIHGSQRLFMVNPQRLLLLRELLLQHSHLLVRLVDRGLLAGDLVSRPVLDLAGARAVVGGHAVLARLERRRAARGARGVRDRLYDCLDSGIFLR